MSRLSWQRDQVELGQVYEREGLLYKVVALIDEPVVVLRPLDERDGDEDEHHVIGSRNFSAFYKIERTLPGGTREEWKP